MLDVDGTLVPYDFAALPSPAVVAAVKKAAEKVTVCVVTGREYGFTKHILETLGLHTGYAVVNNGANVIEIGSEKLIYDQAIEKNEAEEIIRILHEEDIPFYIKQHYTDRTFVKGPFQKGQKLEKAYMFFVGEAYPQEQMERVFKRLSHLPYITLYKTHHRVPDSFGLNITHVKATKLHGVEVIMKKVGLKREELIGVGDSYNDFPLLMACGLKVAMGNAIEDLKAIADYTAPPVTEDGVADVINRFILSGVEK